MQARPTIPLGPGARVIGDLHLAPEDGESAAGFLGWLAERRAAMGRLVVLGDLFHWWIGAPQLRGAGAARVAAALREATSGGCAVEVVPGNRDFLLGRAFEEATGARVHPAGVVGRLEPAGERALLVHGDELCTLDRGYQRMRGVLRSRAVRWAAPRLPRAVTERVAARLSAASSRAIARKPTAEKAMQPEEGARLAASEACATLVCGHAHRRRDERLAGGVRWLVLDAFGAGDDTLVVGEDGRLAFESSRARPSALLERTEAGALADREEA